MAPFITVKAIVLALVGLSAITNAAPISIQGDFTGIELGGWDELNDVLATAPSCIMAGPPCSQTGDQLPEGTDPKWAPHISLPPLLGSEYLPPGQTGPDSPVDDSKISGLWPKLLLALGLGKPPLEVGDFAPVAAATEVNMKEASHLTQGGGTPQLSKRAEAGSGKSYYTLLNATPYKWRRGYVHSYQMGTWDKDWPTEISPGQTAMVHIKEKHGKKSKDSAGEVSYHLEGTSKPMSFMAVFGSGSKHMASVQLLEGLETLNNKRLSKIDLGKHLTPGGVNFVIAGTEGDFISNNGPSGWMQAQLPYIGNLTLKEIMMPRSHHAGLWKRTNSIGFGSPSNSQTQNIPLYDQMTAGGVRVLDVRPIKDEKAGFWESHGSVVARITWQGLFGASLREMVKASNDFLDIHPGELVIWDFHSAQAYDVSNLGLRPMDASDLSTIYDIAKGLKHRLAVPDDVDLTNWKLNDFIGNGTSAVLIRVHNKWLSKAPSPGGSEGFVSSSSFPIRHQWANSMSWTAMADQETKALLAAKKTRQSILFSMDWLLTIKGANIVNVTQTLRGLAGDAWSHLFSVLWGVMDETTYPNWLTMDAIRGGDMKALAMAVNHCLAAKRCGALGGKVTV